MCKKKNLIHSNEINNFLIKRNKSQLMNYKYKMNMRKKERKKEAITQALAYSNNSQFLPNQAIVNSHAIKLQ